MQRREFIGTLAGVTIAAALPGRVIGAEKVYRIGYLSAATEATQKPFVAAFRAGMRDLGYVDGRDFTIEARYADGKFERLPSLARELVGLEPRAMLVATTPANLAAKAVTDTVPIVMVSVSDPIGVGLIASLSRPGGNITGMTNIVAELAAKRLQILKEIVPNALKIAVLINPNDDSAALQLQSAEAAARELAVKLDPVLKIRSRDDLQEAFRAAALADVHAALRMIDPLESSLRKETIALSAEHRISIIYPFREAAEAGGLVAYGTNSLDQYRQAAGFMHKILMGALPADLPVEQPTQFELVINLKTAKALGVEVPLALLARADAVIE